LAKHNDTSFRNLSTAIERYCCTRRSFSKQRFSCRSGRTGWRFCVRCSAYSDLSAHSAVRFSWI